MSGTLEITENLCWMPAGWIFDSTLVQLAEFLQARNSALSKKLFDAQTTIGGGYLDLRDLSSDNMNLLIEALEVLHSKVESLGPNAFFNPSFFSGFIGQMQELKNMLIASCTKT